MAIKNTIYKLRLMAAYKDALRTRVPMLYNNMMHSFWNQSQNAAARLRDKPVVEVAFLLTIPGMWKLDYLFKLMQQSPKYHPYVVIYPYSVNKGFSDEEVDQTLKRTEDFVKGKGFEYVIPYDEATGKWVDINKTLNPDIVFFTTPYKDIPHQYYVYNFRKKLTCYVSYAFCSMNVMELDYDINSLNLFGLNFLETDMHMEFARRYSRSKGQNCRVSGYPGTEVYLRDDYQSPDVWKPQPAPKKRIIWAPHHTIDEREGFSVSTFLIYADTMLELAEKYKSSVQIAFKPHQLLRFKLTALWGKEKTDAYYARWAEMENTQLEESGYVDLFIHSDAMIHDSGSFTTEYLFTRKPVMYLIKSASDPSQAFNDFGKMSFAQHYPGGSVEQIEYFIREVVMAGNDSLKQQREAFFDQYLAPKDGLLPSQKILDIIEKTIQQA